MADLNYDKHTWSIGESITQESMNHIEDGIAQAFQEISNVKSTIGNNISYFIDINQPYDYWNLRGEWSLNRIDDQTGKDINNGNFCRTNNYIEIKGDNYFVFYELKANPRSLGIAIYCYDSDFTYLGEYETYNHAEAASNYIELFENTKYIRISCWPGVGGNKFNNLEEVLPYIKICQWLPSNNDFVLTPSLFNINESSSISLDENYMPSNLKTRYDSGRAFTNVYIPVGAGTILQTKPDYEKEAPEPKKNFIYVYCYDEDFNIIKSNTTFSYYSFWKANMDCYIRIELNIKTDNSLVNENDLNEIVSRIFMYYIPPANNSKIHKLNYTNGKPPFDTFTIGKTYYDPEESVNEMENYNKFRFGSDFIGVGKGTIIKETFESTDLNVIPRTKLWIEFYDKNFFPKELPNKDKENLGDWLGEYTVHEDGYIRILLRNDKTWRDENKITNEIAVYLYDNLQVKLIEPKDLSLLDNLSINIKKSIPITTELIYGDRIKEVSESLALKNTNANDLKYIWISDLHLSYKSLIAESYNRFCVKRMIEAMKTISEINKLDFIIVGGDVIDVENTKETYMKLLNDFTESFKNFTVPVIWLLGNHDDNSLAKKPDPNNPDKNIMNYDEFLSKEHSATLLCGRNTIYKDIVFGDTCNSYFYFDIPSKNKRIICLNSSDFQTSTYSNNKYGLNWWQIERDQVKWICENALNTSYDIIFMSHVMPLFKYEYWRYSGGSIEKCRYLTDKSKLNTETTGAGINGNHFYYLGEVIHAYNNRLNSITIYNRGTASESELQYTTPSFTNAQGHIKYWHCGHMHVDFTQDTEDAKIGKRVDTTAADGSTIFGETDGIRIICTSCAKAWGQQMPAAKDGYEHEGYVHPYSQGDPKYNPNLWYQVKDYALKDAANTWNWNMYWWTNRKFNTINESLFDVVLIKNNKAYCYRVGAGLNREFDIGYPT